jgi:outer membrane protein TolC
MFFSSGLSRAQDTDSVLPNTLVLPELIQEVLARNPELVAARKQWEAASFEYQVISYPENERSN